MATMSPHQDPVPLTQGMPHHTQPMHFAGDVPLQQTQNRTSTEFGKSGGPGFANGNGIGPVPQGPPLQMANVQMANGGGRHRGTMSLGAFEGSRSPPGTKNTSHVPCKFFRSGQCQAGKACPFSHSMDTSTADTPCKYFAKGNCKFGAKCALAHVLPNGRIVNRPNGQIRGAVGLGPRIDPQMYQQQDALHAQSLLSQQANGGPMPFGIQYPPYAEHDPTIQENTTSLPPEQQQQQRQQYKDTAYSQHLTPNYGSPRDDSRFTSFSPNGRLSVLDAPLPASFDSQGISYMARHGPVAASLPSNINLLESSPPASLSRQGPKPLDSVSNLGTSAFVGRSRGPDLGSSPVGSGDEGFGQRLMHSRLAPKPNLLSNSMPRVETTIDDFDDDAFHFSGGEEEYLPTSIHKEILTRDEQQRRHSRTEQDRLKIRESLIGLHTPTDSGSKISSPSGGSPSRFGTFFSRQQEANANSISGSASVFGHVGSPLRNSSLHMSGTSPSSRPSHVSGDMSPPFPSLSSPPRQSSMSMLSQQLSRSRISSKTSESSHNPISTTNNSSIYPSSSARRSSGPTNNLNRTTSNSNTQRSGGTDRIEEEQDTVFSMEDDFDEQRRRNSGHAAWTAAGKSSPRLGPIGTGRGEFT